jgi:hypothetical protein
MSEALKKKWTEEEDNILLELAKEGLNAQQIYDSSKLPNRTVRAIEWRLASLGASDICTNKKFSIGTKISEAEIVGLETIVKRYLDAFNKICDLEEYDKLDLERFRIIFMAAWKYRELFREYQEMEKVEARIEELERKMAEIQTKQRGPEVSPAP